MNKKILIPVVIVAVIIIVAIVMMAGRLKGPEVAPPAGQPIVTPGEEAGPGVECVVGTYLHIAGQKYTITGVEKHTVAGKSMNLCCSEIDVTEITEEGFKMKTCSDMVTGGDYGITWMANKETGWEYAKYMEMYLQNGRDCTKQFDPEGNVVAEACQ